MNQARILRNHEVLHLVGISRATLYRLIKKGLFPKSRKLTGERGRAVGWLEEEVIYWIKTR
ncbi:AlpA family phage regulatory protein [Salmonella enterica]|uniref:AlpA family phage regulatory protein n=1 Tax=Salmonella enterica TaxID=28901 RepID=A0A760MP94_SALER|nr:AlpA family phage regulatory protein [Salmonella enterica]EDU8906653.1 AlpA family phage regulatory protein [Salmonella enterica subsp. enterica]EDW0581179.1 AlpA family phage regulatory protein [Salmonella enterica subsp. enterica serovar Poona]EAT3254235.1 AlpA family phage regulatory protein [Salmonella enterica]EAV4625357.1 AlpA family phage regulatory protein [Salmonella enterica]